MTIYDASVRYRAAGVPLLVIAGKEYGSGSSRDWAAKGTLLLGVKVVHRRELRADPSQQPREHGRPATAVQGGRERGDAEAHRAGERYDMIGWATALRPRSDVIVQLTAPTGASHEFQASARIDTPEELVAFRHGGILPTCCGSSSAKVKSEGRIVFLARLTSRCQSSGNL